MSTPHPPLGQLYSRLYVDAGAPAPDSVRFRTRLEAYFSTMALPPDVNHAFALTVQRELGVTVPSLMYGYDWAGFLAQAGIADVLSCITLLIQFLRSKRWAQEKLLHHFVERALREENLHYTIDEEGGIHRAVDKEFVRNRESALKALGQTRYAAVADALNHSFEKLEQQIPDNKGAVRDCFESAETLTKLLLNTGEGLDAGFVNKRIVPLCERVYNGDAAARMTACRLAAGFADWVNAAHPFRHGQKTEEPTVLPDDLAVALISQGASFVRLLVDVDRRAIDASAGRVT